MSEKELWMPDHDEFGNLRAGLAPETEAEPQPDDARLVAELKAEIEAMFRSVFGDQYIPPFTPQTGPKYSPDDPEFKKAVVAVVLEMKRKRVI